MKLSLVVQTSGPSKGKVITINASQFVIGRDPSCQLRPASIHISKRHCALVRQDDKVFVRDFGSTNGTFVNDRQIKGEIELRDGDQLRVGPLHFTVQLSPAPVDRPTPLPPTKAMTRKPVSGQDVYPAAAEPATVTGDEENVAAMLLAMQEKDVPESGPRSDVPEGTTVFDIPVDAAAEKEKDKPKQSIGDTSSAAKSILDKYLKRPRST
ncbi:MAG: FHA domain-containing protein [Gemmataceae bacterium]